MPNKDITLYLDGSNPPPVVVVTEADTAWTFRFTVMYQNAIYAPNVNNVILAGHKPDGNAFAYTGSKSGNVFQVGCNVQMTAVPGDVLAALHLLGGGNTAIPFILRVRPGGGGTAPVASASALTAYATILNKIGNFPPNLAQYVSDWLAEHISGGETIAVDDTLTVQGAAADAKAAGDRIKALEEATIETDTSLSVPGAAADAAVVGSLLVKDTNDANLWEAGYYAVADGTKSTGTTYIRTKKALDGGVISVAANGDYRIEVLAFSGATYKGGWTGSAWSTTETMLKGVSISELSKQFPGYTFVLNMLKQDRGAIAVTDAVNAVIMQSNIDVSTDETLSQAGVPADAAAVGEALSGSILTLGVKNAILACFDHVAWAEENSETYYEALYNALFGETDPLADQRNWLINEATPYPCIGLTYLGAHEAKDSRMFYNKLISLDAGKQYLLACNPAYSFFALQCDDDGVIRSGLPASGFVTSIVASADQYKKLGLVVKTPATATKDDVTYAKMRIVESKNIGTLSWDLNRAIGTQSVGQPFSSIQCDFDARLLLTSLIDITPGKTYRIVSKYPMYVPRISAAGIYLGCANNVTSANSTSLTYTAVSGDAKISVVLKTPSTATAENIADANLTVFEY